MNNNNDKTVMNDDVSEDHEMKRNDTSQLICNFIQPLPQSVTKLNKRQWNEINIQHLTPCLANQRKVRSKFKANKNHYNKTIIMLKDEELNKILKKHNLLSKWNEEIKDAIANEFIRVKQLYTQDVKTKGRKYVQTNSMYKVFGLSV